MHKNALTAGDDAKPGACNQPLSSDPSDYAHFPSDKQCLFQDDP